MRSGLIVLVSMVIFVMACSTPQRLQEESQPQELRLEVTKAMLVARGKLIEIRYRIRGDPKTKTLNPRETYIVDEQTGEVLFVERPPKLMISLKQMPPSYMLVPVDGKIRKGGLITVVIGGLRQEHIRVEEELTY